MKLRALDFIKNASLASRILRAPALTPDIEALHLAACVNKGSYTDPATGYTVFSAAFHSNRGICCGSSCRHCPWGHCAVDAKYRSATLPFEFPVLLRAVPRKERGARSTQRIRRIDGHLRVFFLDEKVEALVDSVASQSLTARMVLVAAFNPDTYLCEPLPALQGLPQKGCPTCQSIGGLTACGAFCSNLALVSASLSSQIGSLVDGGRPPCDEPALVSSTGSAVASALPVPTLMDVARELALDVLMIPLPLSPERVAAAMGELGKLAAGPRR